MKTITKLFILTSVLFLLGAAAQAQVTATSTATATIISPITITKTIDMNFGNLAVGATGGVVTMSAAPTPVRTQVGGVTFPAVAGTVTDAVFTISGVAGSTYSILLPSTPTVISNAGNTMNVDAFTSSPTPTGTLDTGGLQTLYVGASVTVAANQPAGVYVSGTPFSVTVNYN